MQSGSPSRMSRWKGILVAFNIDRAATLLSNPNMMPLQKFPSLDEWPTFFKGKVLLLFDAVSIPANVWRKYADVEVVDRKVITLRIFISQDCYLRIAQSGEHDYLAIENSSHTVLERLILMGAIYSSSVLVYTFGAHAVSLCTIAARCGFSVKVMSPKT